MFKTIIIIIIAFFCCKIYITNKLNNFMNMVNDKVSNMDKNIKENFEDKTKITKKCDVFKPNIQIPKPIKKKISFNPIIEEVKQDNNYEAYNMDNCYNYLKLN